MLQKNGWPATLKNDIKLQSTRRLRKTWVGKVGGKKKPNLQEYQMKDREVWMLEIGKC